MNHFELFNQPVSFDINLSELSSQFRGLQSQFHPDKFSAASQRDQLMAMQKATQINDAYQTLKSPIQRAQYILSLNHIDLKDETKTMQDTDFLMTQMMLREELENISTNSEEVESLLLEFSDKIDTIYTNQLSVLEQTLAENDWQSAADDVRKLKFIVKLQQEIEQLEDTLL